MIVNCLREAALRLRELFSPPDAADIGYANIVSASWTRSKSVPTIDLGQSNLPNSGSLTGSQILAALAECKQKVELVDIAKPGAGTRRVAFSSLDVLNHGRQAVLFLANSREGTTLKGEKLIALIESDGEHKAVFLNKRSDWNLGEAEYKVGRELNSRQLSEIGAIIAAVRQHLATSGQPR